jgi:hypothetical protein
MPRRGSTFTPNPGSVSVLCPGPVCGRRISPSQVACGDCWGTVPRSLKTAYLAARERNTTADLESARKAITEHLAKAVSA